MFAPGIPPYEVEFESIPYTPIPKFEGPLKPNKDLENIEYLPNQVDGSSLGYLKATIIFKIILDYLNLYTNKCTNNALGPMNILYLTGSRIFRVQRWILI